MNKLILVIEDDTLIRELLRHCISRAGHLSVEAKKGEEGLALAESQQPDLIIMDGHLPGENGIQITQRLKNSPLTKNIPIVALTIDSSLEQTFIEAGATAFALKPIQCKELSEIIELYLK